MTLPVAFSKHLLVGCIVVRYVLRQEALPLCCLEERRSSVLFPHRLWAGPKSVLVDLRIGPEVSRQ